MEISHARFVKGRVVLNTEIIDILIEALTQVKAVIVAKNHPPQAIEKRTHIQTTLHDLPPISKSGFSPSGRTPVNEGGQMNHCHNCGALGRRKLNNSNYCKECKPHDAEFLESVLEALS